MNPIDQNEIEHKMDEIEFRKRVYTNPLAADQEILDIAAGNSELQETLKQTQNMEKDMHGIMNSVSVPDGLKEKLLAIPEMEQPEDSSAATLQALAAKPAANSNYFQYFAVAASLVLALGVTFSLTYNSGPSTAEIAFGNEVLQHLYHESVEVDAVTNGTSETVVGMPMIRDAMIGVGTQLVSNSFMETMPVRFAKPCNIIPAYDSAHLIIEGSKGAVSVFVINNSPVSVEYKIQDERFNGVVIPMSEGNMILVGEQSEDLGQYKDLFSQNVDWVI